MFYDFDYKIGFALVLHQRCGVGQERMRVRPQDRANSEPRSVATRNAVEGDAQSKKSIIPLKQVMSDTYEPTIQLLVDHLKYRKNMYKTLRLILGDQLNRDHSWYKDTDDTILYVMMEVKSETNYVKHHIQKICAFFLAMQSFKAYLQGKGHKVLYINLDDRINKQSVTENLKWIIDEYDISTVECQYPDEYRLLEEIDAFFSASGIKTSFVESEHFLINYKEIDQYFKPETSMLMESFYRKMRKQLSILVDENDEPEGGKWNYDHQNRKSLPKGVEIPKRYHVKNDASAVFDKIEKAGIETIGRIEDAAIVWPIDVEQAEAYLNDFIELGLPHFGTYQDALTDRDYLLFHSRLSFALNTKILHPLYVVKRVIDHWCENRNNIDLSNVEGFVRQIIGWREFIRGIYWINMPKYATMNELEHKNTLPKWYWDGNTKMKCLSVAVNQSLDYAYAHHIQRLMVTGNFALLLGCHPNEIDDWYLGIYIDAIEWVEMPNTRGMSQFADGGIVGTKPYVSSANYINKMSDHCKNCHYNYKDKFGDKACPFNSLYWAFYLRHEDKLKNNPRIGMAYRHINKMSDEQKSQYLRKADDIIENMDKL